MPDQVTLTGATGFVGNNLARRLVELGFQVQCLVTSSSKRECFEGLPVELVEINLDSPDLAKYIANSKCLIHSAGFIWLGKSKLQKSRQVNVELTRSVAQACQQVGCRMIHISSVDALAASDSPDQTLDESDLLPLKSSSSYSTTKQEADHVVLQLVDQGLDALIIHPSFMLGPWDWKPSSAQMMIPIIKGFVPFAPGGGFSVADVRNVAEGIVNSIEQGKSGERYIMAGVNLPYLELWQKFAALVNKKWPKWPMSNSMAKTVGLMGDLPRWVTGWEGQINSASLQMSQRFNYYSSAKAKQHLGFQDTDLDQTIHDAYQWLKEYNYI